MNFTQMRHAKLWFAGQEQNWQLAQYEVDELQEGFDEVVRFHASHKDSPLPLSLLVPKIMTQPMADVRDAIKAHDERSFLPRTTNSPLAATRVIKQQTSVSTQ